MGLKPSKVSVLDLTVAAVGQIEMDVGVPLNRWTTDAPSMAALYVKVLAAGTGESEEKFRAMTLRELMAAVTLEEEDDPVPSPPSDPST